MGKWYEEKVILAENAEQHHIDINDNKSVRIYVSTFGEPQKIFYVEDVGEISVNLMDVDSVQIGKAESWGDTWEGQGHYRHNVVFIWIPKTVKEIET